MSDGNQPCPISSLLVLSGAYAFSFFAMRLGISSINHQDELVLHIGFATMYRCVVWIDRWPASSCTSRNEPPAL